LTISKGKKKRRRRKEERGVNFYNYQKVQISYGKKNDALGFRMGDGRLAKGGGGRDSLFHQKKGGYP